MGEVPANRSEEASDPRKSSGGKRSWRPATTRNLSEYVVVVENKDASKGASHSGRAAFPASRNSSEAKTTKGKQKKKVPTTLKKAIIIEKERRKESEIAEGGSEREASERPTLNAPSTSMVDDAALKLVKRLKELQDRAWKENPIKAKSKRRIVCGLREARKHILLDNVKCVLVARDLEYLTDNDALAIELSGIRGLCESRNIPLLYTLEKHKLGNALNMRPFVSIVAVMDFRGAEDLYKVMMDEFDSYSAASAICVHEDQSSLFA